MLFLARFRVAPCGAARGMAPCATPSAPSRPPPCHPAPLLHLASLLGATVVERGRHGEPIQAAELTGAQTGRGGDPRRPAPRAAAPRPRGMAAPAAAAARPTAVLRWRALRGVPPFAGVARGRCGEPVLAARRAGAHGAAGGVQRGAAASARPRRYPAARSAAPQRSGPHAMERLRVCGVGARTPSSFTSVEVLFKFTLLRALLEFTIR